MKQTLLSLTLLALACAAGACAAAQPAGGASAGWHSLLGADSASAWRGWKEPGLPAGWQVAGGVLSKDGPVDDLVTTRNYRNFELELEWKVGKAGNSGIFYRGTHEYDHIYWSAPEYQLLDDANTEDGKSQLTAAGSDYALYAAAAGAVRPYDHWNKSRLIVNGNHVEHWLNGRKVVECELKSADWKKRVAASKYAKYPDYGLADTGLIGLQGDHPGALAVRNIRIRELR
jgi:3-keto-disaccharide hydrolase